MPSRKNPRKRYKLYAFVLAGMVVAGLYFFLYPKESGRPEAQFAVVPNDRENLFLFVPTEKGGLEKKALEVRATLSERAKADIVFQELRKAKAIPLSARLQELAFGEDGVLYLDISRDVIAQQPDARGEIRLVYSLVNSFIASFSGVNRVQLLIEGHPVYTFCGVVYTYSPLSFNNDLQEE